MLPEKFIYIAVLVNLGSTLIYTIATLRGETQPNRVTWFMWAVAPLIAAAAQFAGGVGLSTLIVFMSGFGPLVIFLSSFVNKKAYWKTTFNDYICGVLSLAGLACWYLNKNQDYAIVFSLFADFFAAIPTVRKAYTNPESENGLTFLLASVADGFSLLCIQQQTFTAYAFTVYLTAFCTFISFIIYRKKLWQWFRQTA